MNTSGCPTGTTFSPRRAAPETGSPRQSARMQHPASGLLESTGGGSTRLKTCTTTKNSIFTEGGSGLAGFASAGGIPNSKAFAGRKRS